MLCFALFQSTPTLTTHHQALFFKPLSKTRFPFLQFYRSKRFSCCRTKHLIRSSHSDSAASAAVNEESDVELGRLLALLPEEMRRRVSEHPELDLLMEVVMDLGRKPLARFPSGDFVLSDCPIRFQDLEHATSQVRV